MAPLSRQRIGAGVAWSLNFATRSRSIAFTVSSASRARRQHRNSRPFSTTTGLFQDPPASTSTKPSIPTTSSNAYQTASPKGSFTERRASKPSVREPPFPTARHEATSATQEPIRDITKGLRDDPLTQPSDNEAEHIDWTTSFHGISAEAFPKETADVLLQPLHEDDIEVKPDGIVYLPEIKYRRILNKAFGPGAWGLAPRGETIVTPKSVTREYALLANGRLVSIARGEQDYFDPEGIPTATEGCKSNALMRCCKDLGIASELWDPRFIRAFMKNKAKETWVEHAVTKKKRKIYLRKDDDVRYPYKEVKGGASGAFS